MHNLIVRLHFYGSSLVASLVVKALSNPLSCNHGLSNCAGSAPRDRLNGLSSDAPCTRSFVPILSHAHIFLQDYKRAIIRSAPKEFTVEVLPPKKLGASSTYSRTALEIDVYLNRQRLLLRHAHSAYCFGGRRQSVLEIYQDWFLDQY